MQILSWHESWSRFGVARIQFGLGELRNACETVESVRQIRKLIAQLT